MINATIGTANPIIDSLSASLIASGTITVVILSIGVQIFFRTHSFDSEYRDKVKAICEMKNSILVDEIEKLTKKISAKDIEKEVPFDEGSPIREFESLASIRERAIEVERWVTTIEDGKQKLRRLGGSLILFGIILGLTFFVMILTKDFGVTVFIMEYLGGIPVIIALYYILSFVRLQRRIDLEYINVGRRQVGNRGQENED